MPTEVRRLEKILLQIGQSFISRWFIDHRRVTISLNRIEVKIRLDLDPLTRAVCYSVFVEAVLVDLVESLDEGKITLTNYNLKH